MAAHRKLQRKALLEIMEEKSISDWAKALLHQHLSTDLHLARTYMNLKEKGKEGDQVQDVWLDLFF